MSDESSWLSQLLMNLDRCGPQGQAAGRYIRQQRIRVGLHPQPTGARWGLGHRIDLHPRYAEGPPDDAYPLSLLIHEVRHLEQGFLTALSVHGELDAWQAQFEFVKRRTGRYHAIAEKDQVLGRLMTLSLGWDRAVLRTARSLMRAYAGRHYRVDLLPLYPAPLEVAWTLARRPPTPRH